jgi:hypothetical protein
MGLVGNDNVVAPFANEAMRLLREDWKGKYGAKMLAEELFPILQTDIPQPDQNFQNFITINAGDDDLFLSLIDKYGQPQFSIDEFGVKKIESPDYPPPKLKPGIVWAAKSIAAGAALGPGELDAVAVDPETGAEVAGVYVYTPPSGTTFPTPSTKTLYVKFTPTDGVKYRRAMGSTVLMIGGGGGIRTPVITWANPADIIVGTALSGTQLNAAATDPITSAPVAGTFTYNPASGAVLTAGPSKPLNCHFVPDDPVAYTDAELGVNINVRHLGAKLRVRVDESQTSQVQNGATIDMLFTSPSGSGSTTVNSLLIGRTYTDSVTFSYNIGTGIFQAVHTATASHATPTGITPGQNPATVNSNVGSLVNSLAGLFSAATFEFDEADQPPGTMGGVLLFVSWIDS